MDPCHTIIKERQDLKWSREKLFLLLATNEQQPTVLRGQKILESRSLQPPPSGPVFIHTRSYVHQASFTWQEASRAAVYFLFSSEPI